MSTNATLTTANPDLIKKIPNYFKHDMRLGKIFGIWLSNLFLNIITLGFYRFWAKTKLRRYIWGALTLDGHRLEYTGTGGEICKGFFKAVLFALPLIIGLIVVGAIFGEDSPIVFIAQLIFYLIFFYFMNVAIFAGKRYVLSRTTWRSIRGFIGGSAMAYANFCIRRNILDIITLGYTKAASDVKKYAVIANSTKFGDIPVHFNGGHEKLMKTHLITLILLIPTLGISRIWYTAALQRHTFSNTFIGQHIRLQNNLKAGDIIGFHFVNMLLIMVTFGLAAPLVIRRKVEFFIKHNRLVGDLNAQEIKQAEDQNITVGEGLEDFMDMDGGLV